MILSLADHDRSGVYGTGATIETALRAIVSSFLGAKTCTVCAPTSIAYVVRLAEMRKDSQGLNDDVAGRLTSTDFVKVSRNRIQKCYSKTALTQNMN